MVKLLLESGASPNNANADGVSALMAACHEGYIDVVETLIEGGADLEEQDMDGYTGLMKVRRSEVRSERGG